MRFEARRARNDDERILPLINVVFLLLIFFMLAGRLAVSDPLAIEPPHSASQGEPLVRDVQILIAKDGRLALDGAVMSDAELGARLAERMSAEADATYSLKADGGVEADRVIAVMELMRGAGVENLTLFTVPQGG
jgi:biopolymer transport protein ExbD